MWSRFRRLVRPFLCAVAPLVALSCSDDPTTPGAGVPASLTVSAGELQLGRVGEALPIPVTVRVLDGRGEPVKGVTVSWAVTGGGGSASPSTTVTTHDGVASALWTLGQVIGANRLEARIPGLTPATFLAQARAGLPARIALSATDVLLVLAPGQDEAHLDATVFDAYDNATDDAVAWSIPDATVATVDDGGRVRASGAGYSVVEARAGDVVGGASLTVENPVPILTGVSPASVPAGTPGVTVELSGSGFVPASVVLWNGAPRPSTFVSSTTLRLHVPAGDLEAEGLASVRVLSPAPGGGTTSGLELGVSPPVPTLRIVPDAAQLSVSEWLDVAVEAVDAKGELVGSPEIAWHWVDPGLDGFLDGSDGGVVRARGVGLTRLAAEWVGFAVDTLDIIARGVDERLTRTVAGGTLTCGLDVEGTAFCWGWHYMGLTPDGMYSYSSWTFAPAPVPGGRTFESLVVGIWHACGLDAAGSAWCWFDDLYGQLGDAQPGTPAGRTEPFPVAGGHRFRELAAGGWHTCGVTFDDEAWCWGANGYGQLGVGDQAERISPVRVAGGVEFRSLAANGWHTCGLTPGGEAYCWGYGAYGQLGRGDSGTCDDPLYGPVPCAFTPGPVDTDLRFETLAVGGLFTCGLEPSGTTWCWGSGARGQLGNGDVQNSPSPTPLGGDLLFRSLDTGYGHACGLTAAGVIHCWGMNDYGNNGVEPNASDGCIENYTYYACNALPVPVSGGHTFASLSTGQYHTCGLDQTGRALCWGESSDGQLGRGAVGEAYYEAMPAHVHDGWMAPFSPTAPLAGGRVPGSSAAPTGWRPDALPGNTASRELGAARPGPTRPMVPSPIEEERRD